MATFFSILVVILFLFSNVDWAFSQDFEALVIIKNFPRPNEISLPNHASESNGQITYPDIVKDKREIHYSYLCPVQTPEITQFVQSMATQYPEIRFSLETNPLKDQPDKCLEEVKPVFAKKIGKNPKGIQCGKSHNQIWYHFGFGYLQTRKVKVDGKPTLKGNILTLGLYNICFNTTDSKAVWTQHRLSNSLLLRKPGLPSQREKPPYEFSTEDYALPEKTFSKIAEEYEKHQHEHSLSKSFVYGSIRYFLGTQTHYKMIPQMLVPQEDIALKIWKKSAIHFVNTASLWDKLVPLMKAINDGIRKAAIAVSNATNKPNIRHSEPVDIHTAVFPISNRPLLEELVGKTKYLQHHRFGLNIWCKYVYNYSDHTGVMIYLHNLPDLPPIKKVYTGWTRYSKAEIVLENTECETPVPCDFRKWADEPIGLTDDLLNYAYCCEVNNDQVYELFTISYKTELKLFNIDSTISPGPQGQLLSKL